MSVYVDIRTGKWFDTRAEMLAFQRARTQAAVSGKKAPAQETRKTEDVEAKIIVPSPETEDAPVNDAVSAGETKDSETEEVVADDNGIRVQLDTESMKERLRENGVDGRRMRGKTDEEIATMYFEHFVIR